MKENTVKFIKDVLFTTFLSFFLISFLFMFTYFVITKPTYEFAMWQFFQYLFLKLFVCVFPFCLCLGFANRIFLWKGKNHALLRVIHFLSVFAAYFLFMDLLFGSIVLDGESTMAAKNIIMNLIPYLVFYPLTLLVTSIGRAILLPKEKKSFKSILD